MAESASRAQPKASIAPLNFIYACSICCTTFADTYEGHDETVQGLSDGINPKERLVTRTYLGSCCHVFCAKHLEGGAPPFHPDGQRPKAACPVCVEDKGDAAPRDLYSIRGFHKDEFDPAIPPVWFTTPPVSLDGKGKEMEALRFQYLALVRYCQNTYAARKPASDASSEAQRQLVAMQNLASEEHAKVLSLQQENEQLHATKEQINELSSLRAEIQRLQGLEQEVEQARADVDAARQLRHNLRELETFKQNKSAIQHYLKLVPFLIHQNRQTKERLATLGFAMALEPIPNFPNLSPDVFNDHGETNGDNSGRKEPFRTPISARKMSGIGNNSVEQMDSSQNRPAKRQRVDSPIPSNMQTDPPISRDAMPPPSKPPSRMTSMRRLIPTLRKKFSQSRPLLPLNGASRHYNDTVVSENGHWGGATVGQAREEACCLPTQHTMHDNGPYMSGVMPIESQYQIVDPRGSQLLRSAEVQEDESDFKFQDASPVKMDTQMNGHRPMQLPTEPSYMRIMDGLSHDTGFEIGLKDPRDNASRRQFNPADDQDSYHTRNQRQSNGVETKQSWGSVHAVSHQLFDDYPSTNRHLEPFDRIRTGGNDIGAHYRRTNDPATFTTGQFQQPRQRVESVVSPFFRDSRPDAHVSSRIRVTEPPGSSTLSSTYRSSDGQTFRTTSGWREPLSLNGLSFFEAPVNSRNEPILSRPVERFMKTPLLSQCHQNGDPNSNTFFSRPKMGHSSRGGYAHTPSFNKLSGSQNQYKQSQSAMPFPPFTSNSSSRSRQLASTVPPTTSVWSLTRGRPQWESLQRTGVRSSHIHAASQDKFPSGSQFSFSNARHSIRQ